MERTTCDTSAQTDRTAHTSPTRRDKPTRVGNVPPDEPMVMIPMDTYHDLLMRAKCPSNLVVSVVAGMAFVAGVMLSFMLCAR